MRIYPFQPLVPASDHAAAKVTCSHLDVYDPSALRHLLRTNPDSFMSVICPDVSPPPGSPPSLLDATPEAVAASARSALHRLESSRFLTRPADPTLYLYRMETHVTSSPGKTSGAVVPPCDPRPHVQTGVVCTVRVSDYDNGRILTHELTRPSKLDACTTHADLLGANAGGPVLLTYHDVSAIDTLVQTIVASSSSSKNNTAARAPLLSVVDRDSEHRTGTTTVHKVFAVPAQFAPALQAAFHRHVHATYIADGHHRAAMASAIAARRGQSRSAVMCAALFPKTQLRVMSFSRVVSGYASSQHVLHAVLARASSTSAVSYLGSTPPASAPSSSDQTLFYARNAWYAVKLPPPCAEGEQDVTPASSLNTAILQRAFLDSRQGQELQVEMDEHMHFVSGAISPRQLAMQVDHLAAGHGDACAFMLSPISVEDIMRVADAHEIMPPKSTSFEPKLRCGLFVHTF